VWLLHRDGVSIGRSVAAVRRRAAAPHGRRGQATEQGELLTANAVGRAFVPVQLPRNPKLAVPFGAMVPFHETFVTVTCAPDWLWLAFQI